MTDWGYMIEKSYFIHQSRLRDFKQHVRSSLRLRVSSATQWYEKPREQMIGVVEFSGPSTNLVGPQWRAGYGRKEIRREGYSGSLSQMQLIAQAK